MSWTNGRPEPEIIVNFADGFSYNKTRLEEFFRSGFLDKAYVKPSQGALPSGIKKEDIEVLMNEFDLPKPKAEKALTDAGGDLTKALIRLTEPRI
ncbi:hypothetical protein DL96DRAFT_1719660 [Flagelloscypha sp. PMI_526]|nr:hypothetical protein DL96DRAFT_1719660 [Flagelloscypha sp. PMI_526]